MKNKASEGIRKVLVIRFRRVGDSVLSVVLCSTIRANFPGAEIHYVLNGPIAPLFWGHPDIDRVIEFSDRENHHFFTYLRKVRRLMHAEKYDVILDTRSTIKTLWFSLFSLSSPYRVGRKKAYNAFLHNYRVENPRENVWDEVARTLTLLRPLEHVKALRHVSDFKLYLSRQEMDAFRVYMERQGIDFARPVVVCAPLTRVVGKAWDQDKMGRILFRIIERYDAQLIFNYAVDERAAALRLHAEMGKDKHIFIDIQAKNIRELGALLTQSNFFFGNEGGPRHVSQAFQVPSFAIYPPRIDKLRWLPSPGERYQGISPGDLITVEELGKQSYAQQFSLITEERVWTMLQPMLDRFLPGHAGLV